MTCTSTCYKKIRYTYDNMLAYPILQYGVLWVSSILMLYNITYIISAIGWDIHKYRIAKTHKKFHTFLHLKIQLMHETL